MINNYAIPSTGRPKLTAENSWNGLGSDIWITNKKLNRLHAWNLIAFLEFAVKFWLVYFQVPAKNPE